MTPKPPHSSSPNAASRIARDLTGDLFCVKCRYNLRGLSITELCPECGLPVKATVLAVVDPLADELVPLSIPRGTAWGLILWPFGAMVVAVVVWGLRFYELLPPQSKLHLPRWWVLLGVIGLVITAASSLTLIRPYSTISIRTVLRNTLALLCLLPLSWAFWLIHARFDAIHTKPYTGLESAHEWRAVARMSVMILAASHLALIRPTVRSLAARSLVVREGRVDRQPMLALIGAFMLAAVGDLIEIISVRIPTMDSDLTRMLTMVFISLGSVLITLGLAGLLRDGIRIFPVISSNPLGLRDIMGKHREPKP